MRVHAKVDLGFQQNLFSSNHHSIDETGTPSEDCQVVAVGKRGDGGTRYWCLLHNDDETATCRASHMSPIRPEDVLSLDLDIDEYKGRGRALGPYQKAGLEPQI